MNLAGTLAIILCAGGPADEARDDKGRWTSESGMVDAHYDAGSKKWTLAGGAKLPSHLAKVKIPPAWKDVIINPNKSQALWVRGKDVKGRRQAVYSPAYRSSQDLKKFRRIQALEKKVTQVEAKNERNRMNPDKAENADALKLIMHTGIRPGSEKDTGAEKQAYGATTLEGRHVVHDEHGNVTELHFTGKKGVDLHVPISDERVARMLANRAKAAGPQGRLFDTDSGRLLAYTHSVGGSGVKTKDFRTLLANRIAREEVSKVAECCKSEKELKKAQQGVAKVVAAQLGNTPAISLKSYINPHVFSEWHPDAVTYHKKAA
jgi:DNA topoisomerase-1